MRKFSRSHWKIVIAILLAIALATLTMETDSASPAPVLEARLRTHVQAIASGEHDTAARHIETSLQAYGYRVQRQAWVAGGRQLHQIEVSVSNTAPGAKPERIFIVGAHVGSARGADGDDGQPSGAAAVLELARLLNTMRPGRGTELKFVFFVNEQAVCSSGEDLGCMQPVLAPERAGQKAEGALALKTTGWDPHAADSEGEAPERETPYSGTGNFIAFVGTLESSALVRQALAAFQAHPGFPVEGLAAPAHAMGVTLSDHGAYRRQDYPALMITDTAFLRYPYYHTAHDTPDKLDYAGMARVVKGLARTIEALAGAKTI